MLQQLITGTYGNLDPHQSSAMRGAAARNEYLSGITREFKEQRLEEVLATTTEKIRAFAPDLLVHEISTPSFGADIRIVSRIRDELPKSMLIALCGAHYPLSQPEFLEKHKMVDFVFSGEYELALLRAVRALDKGEPLDKIPGMVCKNEAGEIVATGRPETMKEIDEVPWPARHFLPMANYFDNPGSIPEPALQMWGSRGCPYSCSYCIWPQLMDASQYRPRSPEAMLDEIEHCFREYGYKSVYFDDDTFNIGKKRMLAFCEEKGRRGHEWPWAIMARADLMDREILEAMAAANLKAVKYGVESANQKLIHGIGKKLNLEKAIRNIELTKELGIKVHLTFMFGLPGETREDGLANVELAKKLNPESVQFSILTPLPGTRIYDELMERDHLKVSDWDRLDGYFSSVVRTESMSAEELEEMVQYAWRSWVKHRTLQKQSANDIKWALKNLPKYLLNPAAAFRQLKRLM